jgi:hypothetical protein
MALRYKDAGNRQILGKTMGNILSLWGDSSMLIPVSFEFAVFV